MNFDWDEAKSDGCFLQRSFDFAYAAHAVLDPARISHQGLRSAVRIISARKANQREVKAYENGTFNA